MQLRKYNETDTKEIEFLHKEVNFSKGSKFAKESYFLQKEVIFWEDKHGSY